MKTSGTLTWDDATHSSNRSVSTPNVGQTIYTARCQHADGCGENKSVTVTVTVVIPPPCTSPSPPTITAAKTSLLVNEVTTLTATNCNETLIYRSNGSIVSPINVGVGTYTATCENNCGNSSGNSNSITISNTDPCSLNLNSSGGDEGFSQTYTMASKGRLQFSFNPYNIPDQLVIKKNSIEIQNSGCIGNPYPQNVWDDPFHSYYVDFNTNDVISVRVIPNCTGGTGTSWELYSVCGYLSTGVPPVFTKPLSSGFNPEQLIQKLD